MRARSALPRLLATALGGLALVAGALTLVGWAAGVPWLLDWAQTGITQKANNAIAMMLTGAAVVLLARGSARGQRASGVLALGAALIGGLTLFQHLTGVNLGIDTLLFDEPPGARATSAPGRMGPLASLVFLLLGGGLLLARRGRVARRAAHALGIVTVALAGIAVQGYVFGADFLYAVPRLTAIAPQTALLLMGLAVALLALLPDQGVTAVLSREDAGGALLRRLLLPVVLLPLVLGWLRLRAEELQLFDAAFGTALLTFLLVILLVALVTKSARHVGDASRQQTRAEDALGRSNALLAAISEHSPDMLYAKDREGRLLLVNPTIERVYGRPAAELLGRQDAELLGPEAAAIHANDQRIMATGRAEAVEEVLATNGARRTFLSTKAPWYDAQGHLLGLVGISHDITERKAAEAELQRHREHLEQLVAERTAELEASHQRLRHSERMAAIGTLSTGLGHDMGNLLMPVRVRLDSLARMELPEEAERELEGIRTAAEYLRRLSGGLRLLALDPRATPLGEPTPVGPWWAEAEPVFRNVLPRGVVLEARMEEAAACWVAMSRPALTQAVFNLVQNAGDALKARRGRVVVSATMTEAQLRLTVTDDGPGMTEEVRRRCMEPFFTTKPRGISTGLGLPLVYGLVTEAGGSVEIASVPGDGATFTLQLPLGAQPAPPPASRRRAAVLIGDRRLRGLVVAELKRLAYDVRADLEGVGAEDLVVADGASDGMLPGRVVRLGASPQLRDVQGALRQANR